MADVGKRPKVLTAIFYHAAGFEHPRELLFGQADQRIGLTVLQKDVKPWPMLLDEVIFQEQGFILVVGNYKLDGVDAPHQQLGLHIPSAHKVGFYAIDKAFGFSNVDNRPLGISHEVDPALSREAFHKFFEFFLPGQLIQFLSLPIM